jgi:hypothetical protein
MVQKARIELRKRFPCHRILRALSFTDPRCYRSEEASIPDLRLKLKYLADHYRPDEGAGVNLDGGKLTVQAERFFGVASAVPLDILSGKTSTCDNDQEGDDEIGVYEVQAAVNADTVRSDELAEFERVRRDQTESHPAVRLWRGIESLPSSGVLYGEISGLLDWV